MFIDVPVMRDIWQAAQADRSLQKLDEEDGVYLAGCSATCCGVSHPTRPQPPSPRFRN
jgi:hypothetical protein